VFYRQGVFHVDAAHAVHGRPRGGELRLGPGLESVTDSSIRALSSATAGSITLVGPMEPGIPPVPPSTITLMTKAGASIGVGTDLPTKALHVVGNICSAGSIGACSDVRFKNDIEPLDGALPPVDRLTGVRYSWRVEDFAEIHFGTDRQVGLVAQEVRKVLPEAVTEQSDGSLTVDYSRLTPVLIQAIKELRSENESLKERVEAPERT